MFNKLRLKLALMNAAVAGVILLALAVGAYVFVAQIVIRQTEQEAGTVIRDLVSSDLPGSPAIFRSVPNMRGLRAYLFVKAGSDGSVSVADFGTHLTQDQIVELTNKAIDAESKDIADRKTEAFARGWLMAGLFRREPVVRLSGGQAFRYRIAVAGASGFYLVLIDTAPEEALLGNVRRALLFCVLGGLLLTALGSLFLAGRALRPIKAAWAKQRDFVADASHELRSPLAAIRCNLDVVLDDPSKPVGEKQPYWQGIVEETDRMAALVDELLLLARADSGALTMQRADVPLAETVSGAAASLKPIADKKGVELRFEAEGDPVVSGDAARLRQAAVALMDNAVKYTHEGGSVSVRVAIAKDRAIIEVADTGIGIAREHLGKIFDRFYRVDNARSEGGYGLGLPIAQWIVQQHGGSLTAASEKGRGSCFTISLPMKKHKP